MFLTNLMTNQYYLRSKSFFDYFEQDLLVVNCTERNLRNILIGITMVK